MSASAANAAIEKSLWEMQDVGRSLDGYIDWVYSTTSDPASTVSTWSVEIGGHVARSQCERRKRRNCRKASVECHKLVMIVKIEKPEDTVENHNCIGIVLNLVDRSDDVVAGTTERIAKARIVCGMPKKAR